MSPAFCVRSSEDDSKTTCIVSHITVKVPLQYGVSQTSKKTVFNVDVPVLKLKGPITADAELIMPKVRKAEKRPHKFMFSEKEGKARKTA